MPKPSKWTPLPYVQGAEWRPIAAFPEFECNVYGQFRRRCNEVPTRPYWNWRRSHDEEYVDFVSTGSYNSVPVIVVLELTFPEEFPDVDGDDLIL